MHAFTVHPQKTPEPAPPAADETPRRRWRRRLAALLLLLLIGGLTWAVRPNRHLARAQELQQELFDKNLPPEDRKARFEAYRAELKQLTGEQKRELFAPMRQKRKAEMDRYFALSQRDKNKYLDDTIDRSEKRKKEQQKGQANGGPGGGGPGGGFGFGPGGGPGGKASSPQEKENRRKQALDNTTPEERAQRDQFRHDLDNRRRQRGLPASGR
jgi:hypothetical protein